MADPKESLIKLRLGNERWHLGRLQHPNQTVERRHEVAPHQDPFAVVFSCIDSRVPPEIVFDTGIGDLFVIRTGAQVLDQGIVLGSVEFGPFGYESARLLVVLGHSECGAVLAAIKAFTSGDMPPDYLSAVVEALRPAYDQAVSEQPPADKFTDTMVRAQTTLTVAALKADKLLAEQIADHGLEIVGGHYDLVSGKVEFFT